MRLPRVLAGAALCSLCLLSTGSAASAGGRFIETGFAGAGATSIGGPVLAGDALVWTESLGPGRSRWRLVREQDGGAREIESYPGGAHTVTPVASPEAVAVYRERTDCITGRHGCESPLFAVFGEIRLGDVANGTGVVTSCPSAARCPIGPVGVGGSAIGWVQDGTYRVRGPGVSHDVRLATEYAETPVSHAGDYVALLRPALPSDPLRPGPAVHPGVDVLDVRSGAVAYHVGVSVSHAIVRADGLLVGVTADDTLFWASATDPQPHPVAQLADSFLGLAGNLFDGRREFPSDNYPLFAIVSLDPGGRRAITPRLSQYARRWLSRHPRAVLRLDVNGKARAVNLRVRWPAWFTLPFSP